MIFPTLALWSNADPQDAVGRIDRALNDRNHRLMAGLSITKKFDRVQGALVVSQGNGKYVRLRHVVESSETIPESIRRDCREFTLHQNNDCGQLSQALSDLAEVQATVVEKLKCAAGKYVDRVLAVSVCDPGFWQKDFDGSVSYMPMCDPTRLAELCGVTVIDAFPARDLCVGGKAKTLDALPNWILFADRNSKIASQTRCLVCVDDSTQSFLLPASDGLDAELPAIQHFQTIGFEFLNEVVRRCFPRSELGQDSNDRYRQLNRLYADGLNTESLRKKWETRVATIGTGFRGSHESLDGQPNELESHRDQLPGNSSKNRQDSTDSRSSNLSPLTRAIVADAEAFLTERPDGLSSVVRTGVRWVVDLVIQDLLARTQFNSNQSCAESKNSDCKIAQVLVACPAQYEACLINQIRQLLGESQALNSVTVLPTKQLQEPKGIGHDELPSVHAALLGLFHIDQMPANIPWITGADSQRILGRLTPGRPANWRQLVRVMADFQPPPMKLKDAI